MATGLPDSEHLRALAAKIDYREFFRRPFGANASFHRFDGAFSGMHLFCSAAGAASNIDALCGGLMF